MLCVFCWKSFFMHIQCTEMLCTFHLLVYFKTVCWDVKCISETCHGLPGFSWHQRDCLWEKCIICYTAGHHIRCEKAPGTLTFFLEWGYPEVHYIWHHWWPLPKSLHMLQHINITAITRQYSFQNRTFFLNVVTMWYLFHKRQETPDKFNSDSVLKTKRYRD